MAIPPLNVELSCDGILVVPYGLTDHYSRAVNLEVRPRSK